MLFDSNSSYLLNACIFVYLPARRGPQHPLNAQCLNPHQQMNATKVATKNPPTSRQVVALTPRYMFVLFAYDPRSCSY